MKDITYNLLSALSIGLLIGLMALVRSPRKKALIYSLPIPITIALIATHGHVDSSNVIGLALICCYLALVHELHDRFKLGIIVADVVSAIAYILVGYVLIKFVHLSFLFSVITYIIGWAVSLFVLKERPYTEKPAQTSKISPYSKTAITSVLAFILFSLKHYLAGVVVTFPYSGVFAVIESKDNLQTLARVFIRNSIAIAGLFVTMRCVQPWLHLYFGLAVSWIVYFIILKLVHRLKI